MSDPVPFPDFDDPPAPLRVRSVLCRDRKGRIQVIAPDHALIDLMNVEEATSREMELSIEPPSEGTQVCAIPGYYALPTVIDAGLLARKELALAGATPGSYLKASGTELTRLCGQHVAFETHFADHLHATPVHADSDEDDILGAIEAFTTRRIRSRLDETLEIPPLPETATRIIAMQDDPNVTLQTLVQVIEADPSIAAKLISWANSARYARPNPVVTLEDAIMRCLGFDMVFNMALGMAVGTSLRLPRSHVSSTSNYWLDALYLAATAEALAQHTKAQLELRSGTCYLGGLLADFGTLVLGHVFAPQYDNICRIQAANPHHHPMYADQYVMNVSREMLAAQLLRTWSLPPVIVNMVRYQNVADHAEADLPYVQLLQLAKRLLNPGDPQELNMLCSALGISPEALASVDATLKSAQQDLGELALSLSA